MGGEVKSPSLFFSASICLRIHFVTLHLSFLNSIASSIKLG